MEDAATAEIARSQLWLWRARGDRLDDGREITAALYRSIRDEELARLGGPSTGRLAEAAGLLDTLVLAADFAELLTLGAYRPRSVLSLRPARPNVRRSAASEPS